MSGNRKPVFREGQQIKDYQIVRYISQGSYGQIYEAKNLKNPDKRLALKALYQSQFRDHPKLLQLFQNEVSLLKKLKGHPNICEYMDNFEDMKYKYLIMEYCNGGDLIQDLKRKKCFTEEEAIKYMSEILEAFKAFHKQDKHIIHRDIKLDNIFLHNGVCKLGDFGFAREVPKGKELAQTWCGSLLTMAPEVIDGKKGYGIQADIYSLGAVFYQGVFGDFPYKCYNDNETQLLRDIKNRKMDLLKGGIVISQDLKDLLTRMLTFEPSERITFEQLYNHKFFNKSNIQRQYFDADNQNMEEQKAENMENQPGLGIIPEEDEKFININLKLVGSINVGKTSISNAYMNGDMYKGSTQATLGQTVSKKTIVIGQEQLSISLFDTAGLEKHNNPLPSSYFKQTDGYILVFDLSDKNTMQGLDYWIEEIQNKDQNDFQDGTVGSNNILAVGNKSDLSTSLLSSQEYKDMKRKLSDRGIKLLEVSAKSQENISGIFTTLVKQVLPNKKNFSTFANQNNNGKPTGQNNPSILAKDLRAGSSNLPHYSKLQEKKKKDGCC